MLLRHLHLPGLTPYPHASHLQTLLFRAFLLSKSSPSAPAPPPTILTFQTPPTYTTGRRDSPLLTPSQLAHLRRDGRAAHFASSRGGLTTFHGPGQLVAYAVLDLRTHGLGARGYVRDVLEAAGIAACAAWGIAAFRTENPGVWTSEERKIAALGVHLRRAVACHGLAINVSTDLEWFGRIVACGLDGKEATSFEREGVRGVELREVADVLVAEMAARLSGVQGVVEIGEEEVLALGKEDERRDAGAES